MGTITASATHYLLKTNPFNISLGTMNDDILAHCTQVIARDTAPNEVPDIPLCLFQKSIGQGGTSEMIIRLNDFEQNLKLYRTSDKGTETLIFSTPAPAQPPEAVIAENPEQTENRTPRGYLE